MSYPRAYGEYVLLERLGSGGMSDVDLAKKAVGESEFERFVVIKRVKADRVSDESFIRMFKDEARITSELNHTNIAQTYDFGRVGDEYFLVLEYVPGIDIRGIINTLRDAGKRVPLKVVLHIMNEVLQGLEYAHAKVDMRGKPMSIVHRDVNPRNIMMSTQGAVKLIDFGVAKAADRLERTRTDHVKGKFRYMSPEQITGKSIDHRADLFALGLTFHELLDGVSPYRGLSQIQIMHKLVSGEPPPTPRVQELPDTTFLQHVHKKALHRDLDARYPDAAAFRADILQLAEQVGGIPKPSQVVEFLKHVDATMEPRIQEKLDNFSGPIDVFSSDDLDASVSDLRPVAHLTGEDLSATLEAAIKSSLDKVQTESASRVVGFGQMLLGTLISVGIVMLLLSAMAYYVFTNTDLDFLKQLTAVPALVEPQVLGEDGNEVNEAVDQAPLKTTGGSSVTSPGAVKSSAPARNEAVVNDSVVPEDSLEPKVVDELVPERANPGAKLPAPVPEVKEVASPVPIVPSPPLVFGMLQVTSAEKGRAITIDGEPTQFTTPARFDWPVGTIEVRVEGYPVKEVVVRESQVNNVLFR